jgi:hypothetical protein
MIEVYFSICLICNLSSMRLPLIFFRENTSICSVKVAYNFFPPKISYSNGYFPCAFSYDGTWQLDFIFAGDAWYGFHLCILLPACTL